MRKLKELFRILYKNMYVGEGMCVVVAELCGKGLITDEEHRQLQYIIHSNKPAEGSLLFKILHIQKRRSYWWDLNRAGFIRRKIFLLGLIIKYSLKNK